VGDTKAKDTFDLLFIRTIYLMTTFTHESATNRITLVYEVKIDSLSHQLFSSVREEWTQLIGGILIHLIKYNR